jgi:hypothetical protein
MNNKVARLDERLKKVEAAIRADAIDPKDRAQLVQMLADDPAAMEAYNSFLVAMSQLICVHQRRGFCASCFDQSESVQAAWTALENRLNELHQPGDDAHNTKGD